MIGTASPGFMRVALVNDQEAAQDDGRVMHLFRNRIELKKSFSNAQEEIQRLKDRVKQQEGATARVQEMLQGLEERLAQPESGYQSLVFYQLKELWSLGQRLLRQFIGDLEAQQLERERKNFFAEFNRRQFSRRQAVEAIAAGRVLVGGSPATGPTRMVGPDEAISVTGEGIEGHWTGNMGGGCTVSLHFAAVRNVNN